MYSTVTVYNRRTTAGETCSLKTDHYKTNEWDKVAFTPLPNYLTKLLKPCNCIGANNPKYARFFARFFVAYIWPTNWTLLIYSITWIRFAFLLNSNVHRKKSLLDWLIWANHIVLHYAWISFCWYDRAHHVYMHGHVTTCAHEWEHTWVQKYGIWVQYLYNLPFSQWSHSVIN